MSNAPAAVADHINGPTAIRIMAYFNIKAISSPTYHCHCHFVCTELFKIRGRAGASLQP
jgi:hypothetical protein